MAEIKLNAQKRTVTGRKVKNLRKEGLVPANVFGKNTSSIAVTLKKDEFAKVFEEAGETGIVKLLIADDKEERPILIQNIQSDPLTEEPLHADLRQIILTEKITAMIPVEMMGESPAVEQKLGILIQTVAEVEAEALPMDLPEHFVVDVTRLANVGDEFTVKDLSYDKSKVEIHAEENLVLAKIEPLAKEEKVVVPPAEEVVEEEAKVPAEAEAPAEAEEAPAEEKKEEEKE
ncbi:MAG TPA: 50S ribosomal protein L25 [Patescibacteria group bacterium]|nr:50S ribosomal protein L25 [Patescibacteria group bacterium]